MATSVNNTQRPLGEQFFAKLRLTGVTASVIIDYIMNGQGFPENSRIFVAIALKNIILKRFGKHSYTHYEEQQRRDGEALHDDNEDPTNAVDSDGLQALQSNLVNMMMASSATPLIQNQLIECLSLMGKRNVQTEWP